MGAKRGQYVYIVCSSGQDYFAEMTAVSIASLRLVSPAARVVVLTDRQTSLVGSHGLTAIKSAVDEFRVVDCPGDTFLVRSRYLKCTMREMLSGQLLYLDSDTIAMNSPDSIWDTEGDAGASPDLAPNGKPYPASSAWPEACAALGWKLGSRLYLNAGVIYYADTAGARAISEQHRLSWLEFQRVRGTANDQVAFNYAVGIINARFAVLPSSYNAQITTNPLALPGAMITHIFTGNFENRRDSVLHVAAHRLKDEGVLDEAVLRAAIASGNPWTSIDSLRKAVATRQFWKIAKVVGSRLKMRGQ